MTGSILLTKSKLTDIASFLGKIEDCSDVAVLYNDAVYPSTLSDDNILYNYSDKLNGYNLIENRVLSLPEDTPFLYKAGTASKLREVLKMTGLKDISLEICDNRINVVIPNVGIGIITIMENIPVNISLFEHFKLYPSYQSKIDSILIQTNTWYHSTANQVLDIVNGNVVRLTGQLNGHPTMVRVSKNIFPLLGVVKTNDSKAFMFSYTFKGSDEDPIVVFTVIYKKFNAIHAFEYTDYYKEDEQS